MNLTGIVLSLMVAIGADGGEKTPGKSEPSEQALTVRVATFNVNYGMGPTTGNLQAIIDTKADIVLLQETTEEFEEVSRQTLTTIWPHQAFRHCCRAGGLGILSKYELDEKAYLESPIGWFPGWIHAVQTPTGPVQVLNVHLRPPVSDNGSWVSGYFTTGSKRLQEIEAYVKHLDPVLPAIVAGDFNETSGSAVEHLENQGFEGALEKFDSSSPTWRWQTSVGTIAKRLDHVFVNQGLKAVQGEVMKKSNSDHLPVVVELELPQTLPCPPVAMKLVVKIEGYPAQGALAMDEKGQLRTPLAGADPVARLDPRGCVASEDGVWVERTRDGNLWTRRGITMVTKDGIELTYHTLQITGDGTVTSSEGEQYGTIRFAPYHPRHRCSAILMLHTFVSMMPSMAVVDGDPLEIQPPTDSVCPELHKYQARAKTGG